MKVALMPRWISGRCSNLLLVIALAMAGLIQVAGPGAAGHVMAQEGAWSVPTNISNTPSEGSILLAIAANGQGNVLVTWVEQWAGKEFIYYNRWDGSSWFQPPGLLATPPSGGRAYLPAVAADGQGRFHLLWTDTYSLYYSRELEEGFWSVSRPISGPGRTFYSAITVGPQGRIHATWEETADPLFNTDFEIYYSQSDDGGETWSLPVNVSRSADSSRVPFIAVDGQGGVHIAWAEEDNPAEHPGGVNGDDVFYGHSADGGKTWSVPINLSQSPGNSGPIRLVADSQGSVHAVYVDAVQMGESVQSGRLLHRRWDGRAWSEPVVILDAVTTGDQPDVAVDSHGNLHVVWMETYRGNQEIFHLQSADGGRSWTGESGISNSRGDSLRPRIAIAGDDEVHVVWWEYTGRSWDHTSEPDIYHTQRGAVALPPSPTRPPSPTPTPKPASTPSPTSTPMIQVVSEATPPAAPSRGPSSVKWSSTQDISRTGRDSLLVSTASDALGSVHVVWSEIYEEGESPPEAIYHTRWNGQSWSKPVPILISPSKGRAFIPAIAADEMGYVHVVWTDCYYLYYSHSWGDTAFQPDSWLEPVVISGFGRTYFSDIAIDGQGHIHVVWDETLHPSFAVGKEILYSRSTDGGRSWSLPYNVSRSPQTISERATIAVDRRGSIHVAWANLVPELYWGQALGDEVYYSRSEDGGLSWSQPMNMSQSAGASGTPNLVVDGQDKVHLFWVDNPPEFLRADYGYLVERMWDGASWSPPLKISPDFDEKSSWPDAATDSGGHIHLLWAYGDVNLKDNDEVFYSEWDGESWSRPVNISRGPGEAARPEITVSEGHKLHAVWQDAVWVDQVRQTGADLGISEIQYVTGLASSPPQAPASGLPTWTPQPSPTATAVAVEAALPTATAARPTATPAPPAAPSTMLPSPVVITSTQNPAGVQGGVLQSSWFPLVAAIVPVMGLVLLVVFVRARGRRSSW